MFSLFEAAFYIIQIAEQKFKIAVSVYVIFFCGGAVLTASPPPPPHPCPPHYSLSVRIGINSNDCNYIQCF